MADDDLPVAVVGGGHNALVAATLLARRGIRVTIFERLDRIGGAAISTSPFGGVDVRISPYAYLVSLFPRELIDTLGIDWELRRRRPASCTPHGEHALIIDEEATTRRSFEALGMSGEYPNWTDWHRLARRVASTIAPTLMAPLRDGRWFRDRLGDEAWHLLTERPLGMSLQQAFGSDLLRGLVLTDGLIGTFARSTDTSLRQNRCYLYHVMGNSTGDWLVPVGGMGTLTEGLGQAAARAGVEVRPGIEVVSIKADGRQAEVATATGERFRAAAVLCGAAPAVLARLLGSGDRRGVPNSVPNSVVEGAQIKVNMVLERLPRLACSVEPTTAFSGTLHVNEDASQLDRAWDQAAAGSLPWPLPCEVYCHSLTDRSVIGPQLADKPDVHTLGLFALQTPARLFVDGRVSPDAALQACLASLQEVLAEPIDDCILRTPRGEPCIEVHTPLQLREDLALPGGNIFHGDLQWPWAEADDEAGRWGVETGVDNVFLCGSGARRGGAVSGIGGHNAAMATIDFLSRR